MWNLFKRKPKENRMPKVIRVYSSDDLGLRYMGGGSYHSKTVREPAQVEKIHNHLMSASSIRIYVSDYGIEYSANTKEKGQVCGSASVNALSNFRFCIRRAHVNYDLQLNDEAQDDTRCKEFAKWWAELVTPSVKAYQNDINL